MHIKTYDKVLEMKQYFLHKDRQLLTGKKNRVAYQ